MKLFSNRAGKIYHVQSDWDCFVPTSLFKITVNNADELASLLSEANLLLGQLYGTAATLPNRDLFIAMYVQKEAVVSSQIEGTQASLSDILQSKKATDEKRKEIEEIVNYVHTLNVGVSLLDRLQILLNILKNFIRSC